MMPRLFVSIDRNFENFGRFFHQFSHPKSARTLPFTGKMKFWTIFSSIFAPKKRQNVTIYLQNEILDDFFINFRTQKEPEHYHLLAKWNFGWFFDKFSHPKSARTLPFTCKMKFWTIFWKFWKFIFFSQTQNFFFWKSAKATIHDLARAIHCINKKYGSQWPKVTSRPKFWKK